MIWAMALFVMDLKPDSFAGFAAKLMPNGDGRWLRLSKDIARVAVPRLRSSMRDLFSDFVQKNSHMSSAVSPTFCATCSAFSAYDFSQSPEQWRCDPIIATTVPLLLMSLLGLSLLS